MKDPETVAKLTGGNEMVTFSITFPEASAVEILPNEAEVEAVSGFLTEPKAIETFPTET